MKSFFQKMRKILSKENDNMRERMLIVINIVASFLALFGMIETFPLADSKIATISLFVFFISLILSTYIAIQFDMFRSGAVIVGITLPLLVFPVMFFFSGGIEGGATVYFTLNVIYTCIMFEGVSMYIFLALDFATDLFTYYFAYKFPDMVHSLGSTDAIFFDSLFSVVMVGIAAGIMIKMHINAIGRQRKKVELQNKALEEQSHTKDNFFASMSHEIRTPINTIIGLNEMILRSSKEYETKDYAQNVEHASKMLLSLVNDILDMSQMEIGKMEIIPFNYRTVDLFNDLFDIIHVQIKEKKLDFFLDIDPDIPAELFGDKKRIEQVMINILTNAVKYTNEGSITFSARAEAKNEDTIKLRLSVIDSGIGIKQEDMANLYDIFKRLDSKKNQKVNGSGLGLAITKQLVGMMGGELIVDSIYTKGSTFTVVLEQQIIDNSCIENIENIRSKAVADYEYKQLFEAPEARILIVDDNALNLKVSEKLLEATRMQIETATSGRECLEKTKQRFYHIILLDHMMPDMDGIETLNEIKQQDNGLCRESAVVIMTANVVPDADKFYGNLGFDAYIEKPVNPMAMESTLLSFIPEDIIEYQNFEIITDSNSEIKKAIVSKKRKVVITTDCVAELTQDDIDRYKVGVMYLYIKTDKGRFADTVEINSDNLAQYLTDEQSFAFADSVSIEEYQEFFAEQLTIAEEVIHISMASNSGKSYSIAVAAAESFGHVHVIDSKQVSCGQSMLVLYAAKLLEENLSVDEMIKRIEYTKGKIVSQFLVPSAKIFYKYGYTSKSVVFFTELLKVHPVLKMRDSAITVVGFAPGSMDAASRRFIKRNLSRRKIDTSSVCISHVAVPSSKLELIEKDITNKVAFSDVRIQKASFSCACNTGVGTFGFAYYVE